MDESLQNSKLIDVASGTGDIAKLFSQKTKNLSTITCIEPNDKMFQEGKEILKDFNNINWIKGKPSLYLLKIMFMTFTQLVMELEM